MTIIRKFTDLVGRVLAALCLYMGLAMASRLLGVNGGSVSPLAQMGVAAFTWLAVFTIGYLFSAVGIWNRSAWGLVVAIGIALTELVLAMIGDPAVRLHTLDFLMALVVLVAAAGIFIVVELKPFSSLHD